MSNGITLNLHPVIYQCGLEHDLTLFKARDRTEVGEKGITLSGGQKARVTLARAIYSSAGILLLDDVLAALDVHTAKWIVDKCLQGDLVKGRTVILVVCATLLRRAQLLKRFSDAQCSPCWSHRGPVRHFRQ